MKKLYLYVVKFEVESIEEASSKLIEREVIEATNEYVKVNENTKYSPTYDRTKENKKYILDLDEVSEDIPAWEKFYIEYYNCEASDAFIVQQGFIYDDEKDDAELIKLKAKIVKNNCTKLFLYYADEQIKSIKKAKEIVQNCPYRVK